MQRPWITSKELLEFTERSEVQKKSPAKIAVMISLAESKIISFCKHDFSNDDDYPNVPQDIKNATLILADALCYNDSLRTSGVVKSESFDDYSYTVDVEEVSTDFDVLGISTLLEPYALDNSGSLFFRVGVL